MTTTTELPARSGERPQARPATPHQQLSQNAPPELQEVLWQRMTTLEHVSAGPSGISLPDTRALHLDAPAADGPDEAFLVGHEFAHLHGAADGSLHATLPLPVAAAAIEKGWAEAHPVVAMGLAPHTLVMLYGPRDEAELEIVWQLVRVSYGFARGASS